MAIGVIEVARRLGIRVPEQLSVMGFDDIRFARNMAPPLTTIAQPMRQIGEGTCDCCSAFCRAAAMRIHRSR